MTSKKYFRQFLLAVPFLLAAGVTHAEAPKDKSDAAITQQVKEEIAKDAALLGGDNKIHVNTKNGVVSLSGLVDTRSERNDIVAKTDAIPGVKSVNDGIAINNNS